MFCTVPHQLHSKLDQRRFLSDRFQRQQLQQGHQPQGHSMELVRFDSSCLCGLASGLAFRVRHFFPSSPKCRREYQQKSYPTYYYCYCKKVRDPKYDAWSVPHSCNQRCENVKSCGHACKTLCHPGELSGALKLHELAVRYGYSTVRLKYGKVTVWYG